MYKFDPRSAGRIAEKLRPDTPAVEPKAQPKKRAPLWLRILAFLWMTLSIFIFSAVHETGESLPVFAKLGFLFGAFVVYLDRESYKHW